MRKLSFVRSFNDSSSERQAVWDLIFFFQLLTGLDRDKKKKMVTENKQQLQQQTGGRLAQIRLCVCALQIWIPHEKVQVTESLLKQASE